MSPYRDFPEDSSSTTSPLPPVYVAIPPGAIRLRSRMIPVMAGMAAVLDVPSNLAIPAILVLWRELRSDPKLKQLAQNLAAQELLLHSSRLSALSLQPQLLRYLGRWDIVLIPSRLPRFGPGRGNADEVIIEHRPFLKGLSSQPCTCSDG